MYSVIPGRDSENWIVCTASGYCYSRHAYAFDQITLVDYGNSQVSDTVVSMMIISSWASEYVCIPHALTVVFQSKLLPIISADENLKLWNEFLLHQNSVVRRRPKTSIIQTEAGPLAQLVIPRRQLPGQILVFLLIFFYTNESKFLSLQIRVTNTCTQGKSVTAIERANGIQCQFKWWWLSKDWTMQAKIECSDCDHDFGDLLLVLY